MCYLEDRLHGAWVDPACDGCKERAIPFALNLAQDLEAEGLLDEAAEYRWLAKKILRKTGPNSSRRLEDRPRWSMCGRFLRSAPVATHRGDPDTVVTGPPLPSASIYVAFFASQGCWACRVEVSV